MIPVALASEPADFDAKVRKPGRAWLRKQQRTSGKRLPAGTKFEPFWTECLGDLHEAYGGVCAYLAVYFEVATGAATTDHMLPKSLHPDHAYEWKNFRLACLATNRAKNIKTVLDPVGLAPRTFELNLQSGQIQPGAALDAVARDAAQKTIEALGLDGPDERKMRVQHWDDYRNKDVSAAFLRKHSPFVHAEAVRQGFIR